MYTLLFTAALSALSPAYAQETDELPEPNSGWYAGVRGGVSIPIDSKGLGWPVSFESGLEFPTAQSRVSTSLGLRVTYTYNPPSVFGRETPPWAVGPLIDGRVFVRANRNVDLYPVLAVGFLFGISEETQENIVLPMASTGVGARIKPGPNSLYIAPELGVTNGTIPYIGLAMGYSKRPKQVQ